MPRTWYSTYIERSNNQINYASFDVLISPLCCSWVLSDNEMRLRFTAYKRRFLIDSEHPLVGWKYRGIVYRELKTKQFHLRHHLHLLVWVCFTEFELYSSLLCRINGSLFASFDYIGSLRVGILCSHITMLLFYFPPARHLKKKRLI